MRFKVRGRIGEGQKGGKEGINSSMGYIQDTGKRHNQRGETTRGDAGGNRNGTGKLLGVSPGRRGPKDTPAGSRLDLGPRDGVRLSAAASC